MIALLYNIFTILFWLFSITLLQLFCVSKKIPVLNFQLIFLLLSAYLSIWFPSLTFKLVLTNLFGIYNIFFLDIEETF